jgi:aryl-alcohol dehydrogenase-like predicted oxidoreductase
MRYLPLGSSGLFVSELCLGTMNFGATGPYASMGSVTQGEADAQLGAALAAGVNFIDTADTYSAGQAERMTGQALKHLGVAREQVVVATKVFGDMGPGPNQRGNSRARLMDGVRASLERLQLDHIDLYQLHGFDPATPVDETLRALDDLVRAGLVRYIGVSNWAAWQIAKALGHSQARGLERFAAVQAYYTVAGRDAERELLPLARAEGLGLLVWSPLAGGLLSGKADADGSAADGSRRAAMAFPPVQMARAQAVIAQLRRIADAHADRQATPAQVAIAWLLHQPGVTSVILGARRLDQLQGNLAAADLALSAEELQALDTVSALPPEYPGWMLALWSQARADQWAAAHAPRGAIVAG